MESETHPPDRLTYNSYNEARFEAIFCGHTLLAEILTEYLTEMKE